LVTAMIELFADTVIFDRFTVYDEISPGGPMVPKAGAAITGGTGLQGTPGIYAAVEMIFTYFDSAFNTFRHVLLDFASLNNFARRSSATFSADENAVIAEIMDVDNAWASRAGFQMTTIRSGSVGI